MNSTDGFKKVIKKYLENRGSKDPLLAQVLTKPGKNIDDCATYIVNQVYALAQGEKMTGMADEEVYSLAIHYFTEDKIDIGSPRSVTIVSNQKIELTEEEKLQARKDAIEQLKNETIAKMKAKPSVAKPDDKPKQVENTLFNET